MKIYEQFVKFCTQLWHIKHQLHFAKDIIRKQLYRKLINFWQHSKPFYVFWPLSIKAGNKIVVCSSNLFTNNFELIIWQVLKKFKTIYLQSSQGLATMRLKACSIFFYGIKIMFLKACQQLELAHLFICIIKLPIGIWKSDMCRFLSFFIIATINIYVCW